MTERYRVEILFEDGSAKTIEVEADDAVWDAAYRQDIVLPSSCLQGWCLTCAAKVIEGEWDQTESVRYYEADREAGFMLPCTGKPLGPMRILVGQKAAMQRHRIEHRLPTPRG